MSEPQRDALDVVGSLTAIHIHPVKSCRAVALEQVQVTRRGLDGDRLFQVVDADGRPVTQRQQRQLATVTATPISGGLQLEARGYDRIDVATPTVNNTAADSLLGAAVEAGDAGDVAAQWFTKLLGIPVRLVAITDASVNRIPLPDGDMELGWADAASVLIANQASQRWLVERSSEPFGMDRFRPNLTIDAEPWIEDTWRDVSIGPARFGLGLAWPRCAIPQIDQLDGSRHREPAKVLRAHRWCADASNAPATVRSLVEGNALFGIGCSIATPGVTVSVGADVVVHRTGPRIIDAPSSSR
ncbi:MAG: MOSC N-terminal beta barrel domain-containing protein [Actinomycetota bacterium]